MALVRRREGGEREGGGRGEGEKKVRGLNNYSEGRRRREIVIGKRIKRKEIDVIIGISLELRIVTIRENQ